MSAWKDCLQYADEGDGMSNVVVEADDVLTLLLDDVTSFAVRCPEQYEAILEGAAFDFLEPRQQVPPLDEQHEEHFALSLCST